MTEQPAHDASPTAPTVARMRVVGAVLGGAGVLLAASTTVWPTKILAVRVPEVGDFTKGYEQRVWGWGRQVVYSSDGVVLDAYSGPNPVPRLVLLVVLLTLAAAGLLTWLVVSGWRGELLAATGTALALATVTASVVERLSFDDRSIGLQPGLVDVTTAAGWLEVASAVLLTGALAVLLVPVLLPRLASSLAARASVVAARASAVAARASAVAARASAVADGGRTRRAVDDERQAGSGTAPLVATLRDVPAPGAGRAPAIGFTEADPDDAP
jgi:hypothetical protein